MLATLSIRNFYELGHDCTRNSLLVLLSNELQSMLEKKAF